ncbi:MAG: ribosome silencing factor, partial [Myxococcota bacterium]
NQALSPGARAGRRASTVYRLGSSAYKASARPPQEGVIARRLPLENEHLAQRAAQLCFERKALDVVVLDVRGRASYTDFIIIASGTSDRHVQSVAEHVVASLREEGERALGSEGVRDGQWALIDCGGVVVHVFHQFTRRVYDLDGLWSKAPRVSLEAGATSASAAP